MAFDLATARPVAAAPPPTNAQVFSDAMYKGTAGVPDLLLNAPNNLINLVKAAFGAAAGATGHPDMMPETTPNPDIVRGALESLGLIKGVQPQGAVQRNIDTLTQGAVGGALTGGASLPGVVAGGTMGALSAGAGEAVTDITKSPTAGIAASLFAPQVAGKVAGGRTAITPTKDNLGEVKRRADVETLHKNDVALTPGQILGGTAQRVEDAMTSYPLAGDFIRSAQRRGHETFNIAATNRALEPIGKEVPPGTPAGRPAVTYAQDTLGQSYSDLLSKMKGSLDGPAPPPNALPPPGGAAPTAMTLRQEVERIRQMGQNLPEPERSQLSRILDNEIINRFTPNGGVAGGEMIKNIESELGLLHGKFANSDNYDVRTMAGAVKESQAALRRMIAEENPQHAAELANVNEGYANFKRVQDASGRVYSRDGIALPSTFLSAVRSGDISKDKSKFTRGEALMQDLSEAGESVMSRTVPDSGSPLRHLITRPNDIMDPRAWASLLTTPLYSSIGQDLTQMALMAPARPSIKAAAKNAVIPAAVQAQEQKPTPPASKAAPGASGGFDISTATPVEDVVEPQIEAPKAVAKPAKTPLAPRNPKERVEGAVYETPKGDMEWSANGWLTIKK